MYAPLELKSRPNAGSLKFRRPLHAVAAKTCKDSFEADRGVVFFEKHPRAYVLAGEPAAGNWQDSAHALKQFVRWAHAQRTPVCGYYLGRDVAKNCGLRQVQAGVSRSVDIKAYSLVGKTWAEYRRALNQGHRAGLEFVEIPHSQKPQWMAQVRKLHQLWRNSHKGPDIGFLLSQPSSCFPGAKSERWFLCLKQGELQAFISTLFYGDNCHYLDNMIRDPSGHRFALAYLIARAVGVFKAEQANKLDLGFCAFQGIKAQSWLERLVAINGKLDGMYNSQGVYCFKRKLSQVEEPGYLLLDKQYRLGRQIRALAEVTFGGMNFTQGWPQFLHSPNWLTLF